MRYLMGIDNGGTFSKVGLFDEAGQQISVASVSTKVITPAAGYTERDMTELFESNILAMQQCLAKSKIDPADVAGISFSGHGKGLYMVGYDGKPSYNGIISTDNRAWAYVEKWYQDKTNEKVFAKTYQKILSCQPVSILAWFLDNHPEVLEKTQYIFAVKDYIRYMLTGVANAEYTDFSGANLVNLDTKAYDKELLSYFGLETVWDKLPPLKYSAELCGGITKEIAARTGLREGTPVAAGVFDINACAISAGVISEEDMCMIAGTWSINEFIKKEPIKDKSVDLNSMFCMKDYFLVEESSPTSAGNLEWFIQNFMKLEKEQCKQKGESIYPLINASVAEVDAAALNLYYLPFINGSNVHVLAKGTFIGLTAYHETKHMLRALYEGVVFSHYMHVEKLLKNRDVPKSIRLTGGAANSVVWCQMFADMLNIPVDVVEDAEHGAKGAAICAGIACGVYADYQDAHEKTFTVSKTIMPNADAHAVYQAKYQKYCAIIQQLDGLWSAIH